MELKGMSYKVLTYNGETFESKPFITAYNELKENGNISSVELRNNIYALYNCEGKTPTAAFVKAGNKIEGFLGIEDLAYGNVLFSYGGIDLPEEAASFIKSLGKLWVGTEPILALSIKDFSKESIFQ